MEEGTIEYTVALSTSGDNPEDRDYFGEICTDCFETLRNWLLAPTNAGLEKPEKSLSDSLRDMVQSTICPPRSQEPTEIKALDPPRSIAKGRGQIEKGELNIVKSKFDAKQANQIVEKTTGKCGHAFKSLKDGKIVCSNAPPGFTVPEGYKGSTTGCGKVLTEGEW